MKQKTRPPGRSQKGRGTSRVTTLLHRQLTLPASANEERGCMRATYVMALRSGKIYQLITFSRFQPDNGCCDPAQPTENRVKTLFGARLRDVFAVRLPRASHLPAAFCAVPRTVTCSLPCLWYMHNYLHANIPHYKWDAAKCQVPAFSCCRYTTHRLHRHFRQNVRVEKTFVFLTQIVYNSVWAFVHHPH